MKKLLLATAVAALSVSAAHAAPQIYGKALLTVDYVDFADDSETQLNSTGSRIGLKGGEALTANTDLVYQLEYGIDIDENSDQFTSRDTYLGLANKQYGTLVAGRLSAIDDNINYVSQTVGLFDGFNAASWDGDRVNNSMAYFSPAYNGLQLMAMYGLDGDQDPNGLQDGGYGVGVKYEPANQPLRAGATYIGSGDFNTIRVSGAYDLNNQIGLGALYQITDNNDGAVIGKDEDGKAILWGTKKENLFALSGTYKTATPWTAYAQAEMTTNVAGVDGDDAQRLVVGGKYGFNKATTGHVYAGYINEDYANDESEDGFGIGTGIEYKF